MNRKKNLIIGGLLAVVFIMAVGYAAFSTTLKINTTAKIGSGNSNTTYWDVHIKSITAGTLASEKVGTASSKSATVSSDGLTATFSADLKSPGDSITYTVVVENSGKLTAKLSNLTFNPGSNAAIDYTYSGIAVNNTIAAGSTASFKVTVTYDANTTSQPASTTNSLTMSLTYVQATS